jgi:hypothetical protein
MDRSGRNLKPLVIHFLVIELNSFLLNFRTGTKTIYRNYRRMMLAKSSMKLGNPSRTWKLTDREPIIMKIIAEVERYSKRDGM